MPITTTPEWQQLALYAIGGAALLLLLFNIPYVGRVLRALFSFACAQKCPSGDMRMRTSSPAIC